MLLIIHFTISPPRTPRSRKFSSSIYFIPPASYFHSLLLSRINSVLFSYIPRPGSSPLKMLITIMHQTGCVARAGVSGTCTDPRPGTFTTSTVCFVLRVPCHHSRARQLNAVSPSMSRSSTFPLNPAGRERRNIPWQMPRIQHALLFPRFTDLGSLKAFRRLHGSR